MVLDSMTFRVDLGSVIIHFYNEFIATYLDKGCVHDHIFLSFLWGSDARNIKGELKVELI